MTSRTTKRTRNERPDQAGHSRSPQRRTACRTPGARRGGRRRHRGRSGHLQAVAEVEKEKPMPELARMTRTALEAASKKKPNGSALSEPKKLAAAGLGLAALPVA